MAGGARAVRVQLLIGAMTLALVGYFVLLGHAGVVLMASGKPVAIGLGLGVFLLPLIGAWVTVATLRAGFAHQRLGRLAREQGMELETADLPRRPSGRIERAAADELFEVTRTELEADPDNWVRWYRLARAYDYAGDRSRARETMRAAVRMQEQS